MRAVLDVNVLVSAALVSKGPSAEIVEAWRQRELEVAVSQELVNDVAGVLRRPHIQKRYHVSEVDISRIQRVMLRHGIMITGAVEVEVVKDDPDDDVILAAAVESEAEYVVTGDQHLLRIREYQGIKIVTPEQFRSLLRKKRQEAD